MKLEPLGDRVVIKASIVEEKKYGSIIIPDTAKEKPQTGEIIAIGTDDDVKDNLKVGDQVIYAKYGGTEISLDNEDYIILGYGDILAKVS
ncbi:MAG: co-chaperone GroES [Calditrichaeota bacterium]|jgi:chaperonin GroES|nr:co-chaperone GroES [Calditrichota bacterium]MBT7788445.1 co-chaperone GroES [Calditrichota bacterium]